MIARILLAALAALFLTAPSAAQVYWPSTGGGQAPTVCAIDDFQAQTCPSSAPPNVGGVVIVTGVADVSNPCDPAAPEAGVPAGPNVAVCVWRGAGSGYRAAVLSHQRSMFAFGNDGELPDQTDYRVLIQEHTDDDPSKAALGLKCKPGATTCELLNQLTAAGAIAQSNEEVSGSIRTRYRINGTFATIELDGFNSRVTSEYLCTGWNDVVDDESECIYLEGTAMRAFWDYNLDFVWDVGEPAVSHEAYTFSSNQVLSNWHVNDTTISNRGAAGTINLTLPAVPATAASIGPVNVVAVVGQVVCLKPQAADRWPSPWTNANGDCLCSDGSAGAAIGFSSHGFDQWLVTSALGSWTDGDSC